ncbi:unnamed protein product [Aspergillus oryzae var. brunneus]|uniref:Unnamed protein product n=1 Tax=Aspergillus oryzae var. brunneus TaxID=332754 RepID=A0ABQ6L3U7_ASPOZ|nr:unnamed protein product [Aspergillus oryzae]GMG52514.1 unnamed protein product [Aspergillus oryzae var. brunneus]
MEAQSILACCGPTKEKRRTGNVCSFAKAGLFWKVFSTSSSTMSNRLSISSSLCACGCLARLFITVIITASSPYRMELSVASTGWEAPTAIWGNGEVFCFSGSRKKLTSQRPPVGGCHPTIGQRHKKGLGKLEIAIVEPQSQ